MRVSLEPDSLEHQIARLERELAHVQEQATVAHTMAMSWKARCLEAEKARDSLAHKLETARRKLQVKAEKATRRASDPADQMLDWLQAQDEDESDV